MPWKSLSRIVRLISWSRHHLLVKQSLAGGLDRRQIDYEDNKSFRTVPIKNATLLIIYSSSLCTLHESSNFVTGFYTRNKLFQPTRKSSSKGPLLVRSFLTDLAISEERIKFKQNGFYFFLTDLILITSLPINMPWTTVIGRYTNKGY